MFDASTPHLPQVQTRRTSLTVTLSLAAHTAILVTLVAMSVLSANQPAPAPTGPLVFAEAVAPPPPPPPAPAPRPVTSTPKATEAAQPVPTPVAAPTQILPPTPVAPPAGLLTGVEGGVPIGVIGGVAGSTGVATLLTPPPPAPEPVRVGGAIKAPALVSEVEPQYPAVARLAHVQGNVIVEATVAPSGQVEAAHVVRSSSGLLNQAAVDAVKQWRYAPLTLNGVAMPFVLTVTVSFSMGT